MNIFSQLIPQDQHETIEHQHDLQNDSSESTDSNN